MLWRNAERIAATLPSTPASSSSPLRSGIASLTDAEIASPASGNRSLRLAARSAIQRSTSTSGLLPTPIVLRNARINEPATVRGTRAADHCGQRFTAAATDALAHLQAASAPIDGRAEHGEPRPKSTPAAGCAGWSRRWSVDSLTELEGQSPLRTEPIGQADHAAR